MSRHAVGLLYAGEHVLLCDAVGRCPPSQIESDPKLALVLSLAFLASGEFDLAASLQQRAERAWPDAPDPELCSLRSLADVGSTWLQGVPRPPGRTQPDRPHGMSAEERTVEHLAEALLAASEGDTARLRRHAAAARQVARRGGLRYLEARALMHEATADSLDGLVGRGGRRAEAADETAPPESWNGTTDQVVTATLRAYAALMRGEPSAALELAPGERRFAPPVRTVGGTLETLGGMICATAEIDLGAGVEGCGLLAEIRAVSDPKAPQTPGMVVGLLWEHEAALELGRHRTAQQCRSWVQTAFPDSGEVAMLSAAAALARGRPTAARAALVPLLSGERRPVVRWTMIIADLLDCSIALDAGRAADARHALGRALDEAVLIEVRRPLIKAPANVIELMGSATHLFAADQQAMVRAVLETRDGREPFEVALTAREREILDLLPTLRSLDEIAGDLWVSTNTVKTHVKAIYAKLGVKSRREAIAVARSRGLLSRSVG